jgi:sigma-B regulation protein RsbU (phosphoserine phosphatase)
MNNFLFFSYLAIGIACIVLWADASRRPEYGKRPAVYLVSILLLLFTGLVILFGQALFRENFRLAAGPLLSSLLLVSFIAFFVLEYSIHMQRIKKSFLLDIFKKRMIGLWVIGAVSIILLAISILVFRTKLGVRLADLFGPPIPIVLDALNPYLPARNLLFLAFCATLIVGLFYTNQIFNFHEGIVRQRKYPFIWLIIFTIATVIIVIFPFKFISSFPWWTFVLINILFAARAYQEYFFYRMFHLNDLHGKLTQSEKSRTQIINEVIASTAQEDRRIIGDTLASFLDSAQRSLTVSNFKFNGIMAYRKQGGVLQIDSPELILNYCVPLMKLDAVKRLGQRELNSLIIQQIYDIEQIRATPKESLPEIGHAVVKEMLETKERVIVEIPASYKPIFRLIVAYPIFNREELTGFVVLFKTEFDQIFPQEDTIIRTLTGNLSIIFAIMEGKGIQKEKNRLSGEMDIARTIQISILPKAVTIPGYEAAGSMVTASEVGGDVYDVFASNFGTYLDIGDVSGHGLPAGMMALIHMSALHGALFTAQSLKKELGIAELYNVINKTLCSINKNRIGSDKFMTCSLLVEKDGTFTHAGTHLISLLYKKKAGEVVELRDMIDKTAFLGLSELVDAKTSVSSFTMESGDVFLLYTDGAIEAKNQNDEQFGMENLKSVFKNAIDRPVEEILRVITSAILEYAEAGDMKKFGGKLADDVSLVALRKS